MWWGINYIRLNVNETVENARTSRLGKSFWGASLPWRAAAAYGCATKGVAKVVTVAHAKNHFGGQNLYEGTIMQQTGTMNTSSSY